LELHFSLLYSVTDIEFDANFIFFLKSVVDVDNILSTSISKEQIRFEHIPIHKRFNWDNLTRISKIWS